MLRVLKRSGLLVAAGIVCLVVDVVNGGQGLGPWWGAAVVLILLGTVAMGLSNRLQRPPADRVAVLIGLPLSGILRALNSPGNTVPSHGTHGYGQTYAIDLIQTAAESNSNTKTPTDDAGAPGPQNGGGSAPVGLRSVWWPPMRRPGGYASFGVPVVAVGAGEVVAVHDRQRDHLTRDTWPGFLYFLGESFVRSLGWPRHVLGNHVVIRLDDEAQTGLSAGAQADTQAGVHVAVAHLRRDSVRVRPGQRVGRGDVLADCGNSGNSSEPHVHLHLMDGPDVETATGVPFLWDYVPVDPETGAPGAGHERGVPANGAVFGPVGPGTK